MRGPQSHSRHKAFQAFTLRIKITVSVAATVFFFLLHTHLANPVCQTPCWVIHVTGKTRVLLVADSERVRARAGTRLQHTHPRPCTYLGPCPADHAPRWQSEERTAFLSALWKLVVWLGEGGWTVPGTGSFLCKGPGVAAGGRVGEAAVLGSLPLSRSK